MPPIIPAFPYPHSAPTLDVPAPQSGQLGVQLQHLNQQAPLIQAETAQRNAETQHLQSSQQQREEFKQKVGFYPEEMDAIVKTMDNIEKVSGPEEAVKFGNSKFFDRVGIHLSYDTSKDEMVIHTPRGGAAVFNRKTNSITPILPGEADQETMGNLEVKDYNLWKAKPENKDKSLKDYKGEMADATRADPKTAQPNAKQQAYLDAALPGYNAMIVKKGGTPVKELPPDEKVKVYDALDRVEEKNRLDAAKTMFYDAYTTNLPYMRGVQSVSDPESPGGVKLMTGMEAVKAGKTPAKIGDIQKVQSQKSAMADVNVNMKQVYDLADELVKDPKLVAAALAQTEDAFPQWLQGELATKHLSDGQYAGLQAVKRLRESLLSLRSILGPAGAGSDTRFQALVNQLPGIAEIASGNPKLTRIALVDFQKQLNSVWSEYEPTSKLTNTQIPEGAPVGSGQAQSSGLAIGTVKKGYRYKGGNPADQNSWEKTP